MRTSKRIQILILLGFSFIVLYIATNRFHFIQPFEIPFTVADQLVGFDPKWVWIYLLTYPYVVLPVLLIRKEFEVEAFSKAFVAVLSLSAVIFVVYPTTMLRPLADPASSLSELALEWLRMADTPANCVPSAHVSLSLLASFALARVTARCAIKTVLWIFFFAICFSTMAVKQHVVIDVLSGATVGVGGIMVLIRAARKP